MELADKSIFIATPMYGGNCTAGYTESLVNTVMQLVSKGYYVQYCSLINESLITRARNTLTEIFLQSSCKHLLFIDADQTFRADDIERMYNEDKDILGAVVPMKSINWTSVREAVLAAKPDLHLYTGQFNINPIDENKNADFTKVFEVKYVGTGMMLINRNVFDKLSAAVKKYKHNTSEVYNIKRGQYIYDYWNLTIDEREELLSEDYQFCKLWRDIGGKVYAVAYPKITHFGTYGFNGKLLNK